MQKQFYFKQFSLACKQSLMVPSIPTYEVVVIANITTSTTDEV